MSPGFREARKTGEIFGRRTKRRITWWSWTEVKVNHGRRDGCATGGGRPAGQLPEARQAQLQAIGSRGAWALQGAAPRLRRLKSGVVVKSDPAAWVCGTHLQGQVVRRGQKRCLFSQDCQHLTGRIGLEQQRPKLSSLQDFFPA